MTTEECLFAGLVFLETDPGRLLSVNGAPEHLREILERSGDSLETEYVRLFLSPTAPLCTLWQSAHVGDRTLMGPSHLSALQWYARYGAVPRSSAAPADHAGLLLTFYAQLIAAGAKRDELRRFAESHLSWIPDLAGEIFRSTRLEFYREWSRWLMARVPLLTANCLKVQPERELDRAPREWTGEAVNESARRPLPETA